VSGAGFDALCVQMNETSRNQELFVAWKRTQRPHADTVRRFKGIGIGTGVLLHLLNTVALVEPIIKRGVKIVAILDKRLCESKREPSALQ